MDIELSEDDDHLLRLTFARHEIEALRALLARASYMDPNPRHDEDGVELAQVLYRNLPEAGEY